MKVTNKSGFKCEINDKCLTDWRFAKAVAKSHSDDDNVRMMAAVDMVSLILRENEDAYYDYVAKHNDGIVDETVVTDDLIAIINQVKDLKN